MRNPNKEYFRDIYPKIWIPQQRERLANHSHYQYQEIMLDNIEGFPGCNFIELGCGSGDLMQRMVVKYPGMRLHGVDLGRESLLYMREVIIGNEDCLRLVEGDVTFLPYKSNTFDRVLVSSVLWYIKEPDVVIREIIRILKPGGRFVFDVRNPYHVTNFLARVSLFLKRSFMKEKLPYYSFYTPKSISKLMKFLPVTFNVVGYFVLIPTRLPIFGDHWGNWASQFPWLSFKAGHGLGSWLSFKLLVIGNKL